MPRQLEVLVMSPQFGASDPSIARDGQRNNNAFAGPEAWKGGLLCAASCVLRACCGRIRLKPACCTTLGDSRHSLNLHSLPLNSRQQRSATGFVQSSKAKPRPPLPLCGCMRLLCNPVPRPTSPGSMHVESCVALQPSSSVLFTYLQHHLRPSSRTQQAL